MIARLMSRPGGWLIALLLAAAVFVAVNIGARGLSGARIDLTEDRLFTLTEGTEAMLAGLERPVSLTYYYSARLGEAAPAYATFATRVRDMLDGFAAASGGKITVQEVDPEPFSETEDLAVEAGIQPISLGTGGLDNVYFGLSAQVDLDDGGVGEGSVPLFQQDRGMFLEYDLAKLVTSLALGAKRKLGIITSVDLFGVGRSMGRSQAGPWAILDQLNELYEVAAISTPQQLRDQAPDLLLILHPSPLEDPMLYAIDQYLLGGGDAVLFLDPNFESAFVDQGMAPLGPVSIESNLAPILEKWGIKILPETVLADRGLGRLVNAGTASDVVPAPYVGWLDVQPENLNAADPITAQLNQLLIPTPGIIELADSSGVTAEPLILSSTDAAPMDREGFGQQPDIAALTESFVPDETAPFVIAARLSGQVETAFPEGPPEEEVVEEELPEEGAPPEETSAEETSSEETSVEETTAQELPPHLATSIEPLNVVLVADADMLVDRFWVQTRSLFGQTVRVPHSDNGAFLNNALDSLAGAEALIGLRGRGTGERPFSVIDDMQRQAEETYRAEERALRQRLEELQAMMSNPEENEAEAIEAAREELLDTRRRLREVNRALNADIETLETRLAVLNIGVMPILVALAGFAIGWRRRR